MAPEIGTRISVKQVSRQLNQSAPPRQLANRSGSRITLLISVLSPWPNESMSLVNRVISSDEPWSEKLARSRLIVRRKKTLRMSKSVSCMTEATSVSCRNMKKPFKATPIITSPMSSNRLL